MKYSGNTGRAYFLLLSTLLAAACLPSCSDDSGSASGKADQRPNFLFILSDDQSWEHTSFVGYPLVETPNFDAIARRGIYFANAYATAPTCTASRSSILAGQPIWRLGAAANLHGAYSPQMLSYQNILAGAGYAVGYTGKGWEPGHVPRGSSEPYPPTGKWFSHIQRERDSALGAVDLPGNFEKFLDQNRGGAPFSFWVGSVEPHRPFSGQVENRFKDTASARHLPGVVPNIPRVRADMSAYLEEIEVFDRDIGALVDILESRGLLDNTLIIVTSDNGMPFPRGKASNYQYGVRVPMAVQWGAVAQPGRVVEDFVSLADIAPTLLELAGVEVPRAMTGQSIGYALHSDKNGQIDPARDATYSAFERHQGYIRDGKSNLTYPRRGIHTRQFTYIRNYFPDRWPAGDPPEFVEAYAFLLRVVGTGKPIEPYFSWATARRPAQELYDIQKDPNETENLAQDPAYADVRQALADRLHRELVATGDPLEISGRDEFQDYKYWFDR